MKIYRYIKYWRELGKLDRAYRPPFLDGLMCAKFGHIPTRNYKDGREIPYGVTLCKRCGEKLVGKY